MIITVHEDTQKMELTIILEGYLSRYAINELRNAFDSALHKNVTRIVVDVSQVHALSAAGLQALLDARNQFITTARDFVLTGVCNEVAYDLHFSGMDTIFAIGED